MLYDRNIIGTSSEIIGYLRQSSAIFGNLRQCSGNVRKIFEKCSETFVKPSEQFWKIFGNLRKVVGNLRKIVKDGVFIINRIIHGRLEIWNLSSRVHIRYLTRSLRSLVRCRCEHSKINSISPRAHVLLGSLSTRVFDPRTATGRDHFAC